MVQDKYEINAYLETQQSNVAELKRILIERCVHASQLTPKLGLDFNNRFPKGINTSNLIAILK
jgi:hypothetical protein